MCRIRSAAERSEKHMSNASTESLFKFVFFLAVIVFLVLIIGIFLLIIKFLLNFFPEINILGVMMTN
jgi:ABC-type phosphate transport system permease subunit